MDAGARKREQVTDLVARWLWAREEGRPVSVEELCGGDRELEVLVRGALEAEAALDAELEMRSGEKERGLLAECLGGYRILEEIGRGGMARVYLAVDDGLARVVALKVLEPALVARDAGARLRFRREAAIAASLEHDHIVPVHGYACERGLDYLVMKYFDGGSLASIGRRLPPREAAGLLLPIVKALAYAHAQGVVHRDVKPANILLHRGRPCLVDFGLAAVASAPKVTEEGVVPGTLEYLPPERLAGRAPRFAVEGDVYALGCTAYELIAGHPPFRANDRGALMRSILEDRAPDLDASRRDRDLAVIIGACLEKDPRDRYADVTALAEDLSRFLADQPIKLRPIGALGRFARFARRRPRSALLVILSAIALTALLGFLSLQWVERRSEIEDVQSACSRALRLGDTEAARLRLDSLRSLRAAPRLVESVREQILAREAIEDALDFSMATASSQSAHDLMEMQRLLDETRARTHFPDESLAIEGLFAFLQGNEEACHKAGKELIIRARWPRFSKTLLLLAPDDGTSSFRESGAALPAAADAQDHLLTFAALRAGEVQERQGELLDCLAKEPPSFRAGLAWASDLSDRSRYSEALAVLRTLRPGARALPLVHSLRADALIALGRAKDAIFEVESIPRERWSAAMHGVWLRARSFLVDHDDLLKDLLLVPAEIQSDGAHRLLAASIEEGRRPDAEIKALLQQALMTARTRRVRDLARAQLMLVEIRSLVSPTVADVERMELEAVAALSETRWPMARSRLLYIRGVAASALGKAEVSLECFLEAIRECKDDPLPPLGLLGQILDRATNRQPLELARAIEARRRFKEEPWDEALFALQDSLETLLDKNVGRSIPITPNQRLQLEVGVLLTGLLRDDWDAARKAGQEIRSQVLSGTPWTLTRPWSEFEALVDSLESTRGGG